MNKWQNFIYWLTIRPRLNSLQRLLPGAKIYPCGSRYVCNPPALFTDIDFLVYSEEEIKNTLISAGFKITPPSEHYMLNAEDWEKRSVWRRGVTNLIVTGSPLFRDRWNVATHLCKMHNVRAKWERIIIYEGMRLNFTGFEGLHLHRQEIHEFLLKINGPYSDAILRAYMAKNVIL